LPFLQHLPLLQIVEHLMHKEGISLGDVLNRVEQLRRWLVNT
jgi:hypothetical protein